ncbi:hypothetical protein C8039_07725 [Halogeometricum sp. wsp3]|nr:hypothetical protein C8039_07725 [Halogeometricum sp. wsp3]
MPEPSSRRIVSPSAASMGVRDADSAGVPRRLRESTSCRWPRSSGPSCCPTRSCRRIGNAGVETTDDDDMAVPRR